MQYNFVLAACKTLLFRIPKSKINGHLESSVEKLNFG